GLLPPGLPARDLVTVLGNLLDNAIEAAAPGPAHLPPEPPRVRVNARVAGGELLLRVADNGPGVAADAAEEIFRRGWTTKQSTTGHGHGLGLALVQQAVRRNGGTVALDPAPEGGARFTVRLPLRSEARA
ncbi:ATP-binding protein, partial [Streptomyces lydicus]|uniref:sensor histidine kinase n=1 Tax=Streptomyces lydicus TaxID=47763 RepID=UPI00333303DB